MDIFERFNSKFGQWYGKLFGGDAGDMQPQDVLRKIIAAMEDSRTEGFDGKVYVPNKYVLELAVDDPEEREYLLSFLDEEELVGVLQNYMAQNDYKTRGPLDFTIAEVSPLERAARTEKLRVRGRYEKGESAPTYTAVGEEDDLPTVPAVNYEEEEPATVPAVAWAALAVTSPEGRKSHFSLTKPIIQIGRSRNAGNDLVLDTDGMVSKSHARLERERDGHWTLYDLGSTNGIKIGSVRVESNRVLSDGDEIVIGGTHLVFQQQADALPASTIASPSVPLPNVSSAPPRRARLIRADGEVFVLASETLIGRAVTSDIILADPSVAIKHARIVAPDAVTYFLEDLAGHAETHVNGRVLFPGQRLQLSPNDILTFGSVSMRFVSAE